MTTDIVTRRAGLADLDALLNDVAAGFASYVAFAPPGWQPPDIHSRRDWQGEILADDATWALLAVVDEAPVGHLAFIPGRERGAADTRGAWWDRPLVPGPRRRRQAPPTIRLSSLWQLFVLPAWWGRGVAALLHDAAIDEMRAQGYEAARLFTPTDHARARRFYERRRWTVVGQDWNNDLALSLSEYRLDVAGYSSPGSQPSR